nr:hypothetical protein [Tanacetum cinerariifolium]
GCYSGEEDDEKVKDEMCLVAQASSEICLGVDLEPNAWIKDSRCSKHMTGNRKLFSSYKAYNGGQIFNNKYRVTFSKHDNEITKDGKVIEDEDRTVLALWEVILNGDSPPPTRSVKGVETPYPPTIIEEKTAKPLMKAIEKRFGGNKESKKVQMTLLKQQYENFNGTSSYGLDQIYNRLQKLINWLEIHQETISQEDLNMKLLRVNTAYGASAASFKTNASNLPNVDSLSDVAEDGPTYFALMAYTSSSSPSSLNSDTKVNDKYNLGGGYHAVSPPYTGNYIPPKPDLVFADEHVVSESVTSLPDISKSEVKTSETKLKNTSALIIKDCVSDGEDKDEIETESKQIKPSFAKVKFVKSIEHVKSPRKFVKQEESNRQTKYPRKTSQSPKFLTNSGLKTLDTARHPSSRVAVSVNTAIPINNAYPRSTVNGARPASNVFNKEHSHANPQYTLQDQGIFDSRCSRHMTGNKSFITDYQEIDGGFVAFEEVLKEVKFLEKFSQMKGIKREFSVAKTLKQNKVAERKKRTLIEATRTMLADSLLPTTFWAEAFSIACYVQNRVLVTKPHNKTPYELLIGRGPEWLFDIDSLINFMKYEPVTAENQTNDDASIKINVNACSNDKDTDEVPDKRDEGVSKGSKIDYQERTNSSTQDVNIARPSINTTNTNINTSSLNINIVGSNDLSMPSLEETDIFDDVYDDREVGAEADIKNLELSTFVSPIPTTRMHKDHPKEQINGDLNLATQTRRMINFSEENAMELLQFKLHKVWTLVDLPNGKRAIGTKWVFRNQKDKRGIVVRNKARLVTQGYTQEKGIDYDEVFAPVARMEAIRLFLAYASFIEFIVYQMDVKSAFLYSTIEEDVYVCQPPSFEDPHFPNKVHKVEKSLYGLHQAPRAWYETLSTYLLENRFRRGIIVKTLFIKKDRGDIILVQVYVDDIIFRSTKKFFVMNLEFKLVVEQRLVINGCLDWIATATKNKIQVSAIGLTYY